MNKRPIGIFDSGIGGLTVVKEIIKVLPYENIIYLGDTERVPYGTRDNETIKKFADELVRFMLKKRVKAIVVACNTMSAVALSEIKKTAGKIPVIDVISPTVRFALSQTQTNILGVIGTRATINSRAYQAQIARLDRHIDVVTKACPLFVPLVEEGLIDHQATKLIAAKYLEPFKSKNIDTFILGCTHYPILLKTIKKVLRRKIKIIDSANPAAVELKKLLERKSLLRTNIKKPTLKFFVTDAPSHSNKTANLFFDNKFPGKLEKINI